jgi:DNA polymerase-4
MGARHTVTAFCRDCLGDAAAVATRCGNCGSPRLARHDELDRLSIAHVDCDAFYATIEKRDDPSLAAEPVIVGGGRRGVVAAACYVARTYGVRSAMPMFEALRLCPQARVVRPDIAKYSKVGREVRQMMLALTPQVEPLSIDEAFLDLSGTERLHGLPPAKVLARFALAVEEKLSITVSIGLSCNKFLAKIASDLDKPRGFAALGGAEAPDFLAPKPVSFIFGVGKASAARFARDGLHRIADLQRIDEIEMMRRYGEEGRRLARLSRGIDHRFVSADRETKSVSAETTFERDIADFRALERILWSQTEEVSARLKAKALAGATVTLKLKTADFKIRTRAHSFSAPTQLAAKIFAAARGLLEREANGTKFRLLGVGASALASADQADPADFVDARSAEAEHAVDRVRARFGDDAVVRGLAFEPPEKR